MSILEMTIHSYKLEFDQQRSSTTRRSSDRTHRMLRHEYKENGEDEDFQIVALNSEGCVIAFDV